MISSLESQFPNFNTKPTRALTRSLRATLHGSIHSVCLARRRFRTSLHMQSTYSRAGPRFCLQTEDTGIVCKKYTLHVYSKPHTNAKEQNCVHVFSMLTRKCALSFQRHNNNTRVVDTCIACVPAPVEGRINQSRSDPD